MSDQAATATATEPSQATAPVDQTAAPAASAASVAPVDWTTHIPKDLASEKSWERVKGKDLGEVLKRYVDLEKYNAGAIKLPGEKDTPEEREKRLADIYGKLGRPADVAGYKADVAWPEGYQVSDAHDQGFKQAAHKLGLTNSQYQGIMQWFAGYVGEGMQGAGKTMQQSREEGERELKEVWKQNYEKNVSLARRGFGAFAKEALGDGEKVEALVAKIEQTPLANDPNFMQVLAKLGAWMQEDNLISGETETTSKDGIQQKIAAIKAEKAYWDNKDPRHKGLVAEVDKLYQDLNNPVLA